MYILYPLTWAKVYRSERTVECHSISEFKFFFCPAMLSFIDEYCSRVSWAPELSFVHYRSSERGTHPPYNLRSQTQYTLSYSMSAMFLAQFTFLPEASMFCVAWELSVALTENSHLQPSVQLEPAT